jgi:hypothetical protein
VGEDPTNEQALFIVVNRGNQTVVIPFDVEDHPLSVDHARVPSKR